MRRPLLFLIFNSPEPMTTRRGTFVSPLDARVLDRVRAMDRCLSAG